MLSKKEKIKEQRSRERCGFIHPEGKAVFSFARQSSGDEAESASIADQLSANRKTADRLNLTIAWEDWDANTTGYSYPDTEYFRACYKLDFALQKYFSNHAATGFKPVFRDGLGFIFRQMRKGDILLLDTATRLVRATTIPTNESNIWNWLEMMEIQTYVGGHPYNPRDIGAKIISAVETQSKEEKARNAVRGLKSARDKGVLIGFHGLFGYRFSISRKNQILTPHPEEFPAVRKIFQDFIGGKGKNAICREINAKFPYCKWNSQRLNNLLDNPKYAGVTQNSDGNMIPCPAISEPALSPEEWEKVRVIQSRYHPRKEKAEGRTYLLSGLVRCGYCGGPMKPQANRSGRADKYYICQHHASYTNKALHCRGSALIDSNEKQCGLENLIEYFGLLCFLRDSSGIAAARLEREIASIRKKLQRIDKILKSMNDTLSENFMLFETLKIPMENAGKKKIRLSQEIAYKTMEIENLRKDRENSSLFHPSPAVWRRFSNQEKQIFLRNVIRQFQIFDDHYTMIFMDDSSLEIPKCQHGKRLFNPEIKDCTVSRDFARLTITLKNPFEKEGSAHVLYHSDQLKVIYLT